MRLLSLAALRRDREQYQHIHIIGSTFKKLSKNTDLFRRLRHHAIYRYFMFSHRIFLHICVKTQWCSGKATVTELKDTSFKSSTGLFYKF